MPSPRYCATWPSYLLMTAAQTSRYSLQQAAHVLGVELTGERGRSDQIAEDHGDLAPLDARCLWVWGILLRRAIRRSSATRAEFCRSRNKSSAITERKSQRREVLLAQIWHHVEVNVVLREDLGIFFKANTY